MQCCVKMRLGIFVSVLSLFCCLVQLATAKDGGMKASRSQVDVSLQTGASELSPDSVKLVGVALMISQRLKMAGFYFTVKDQSHKVAKLPQREAIKNSFRFKIDVTGAEEPIGVTEIELSDQSKRADIMAAIQAQWKMVEAISPGKYSSQFIMDSESSAVIMLVARKSDASAAEKVRAVVEKQ